MTGPTKAAIPDAEREIERELIALVRRARRDSRKHARLVHPELGELAMHNVAPRLSETPGRVRHVGPELGEHNHEIYHGLLGLADDTMSALRSAGVI